jgi:glycerophosphoryl diester phosphodiesterase
MSTDNSIIPRVYKVFRYSWRQLLATHALYGIVVFVVLTPLFSLLLRLVVRLSGETALIDTDILYFLLRPVGLLSSIGLGCLVASISLMEMAALMTIGYGAGVRRLVDYRQALGYITKRALPILRVAARMIVWALIWMAPFIAASFLVFLTFLTKHDINYYLYEQPPVFWVTGTLIALILSVGLVVLISMLARWAFALPLLLFRNVPVSKVLLASKQDTIGRRMFITWWLLGWLLAMGAFSGAVTGILQVFGWFVVRRSVESMGLLIFTLAGVMPIALFVSFGVTFVNTTTLSLLLVDLYRGESPPQHDDDLSFLDTKRRSGSQRFSITGRTILWGSILSAVIAGTFSFFLIRGLKFDDHTQITAHRGASAAAPENTLAAVERGITDGADWIEIDVQETSDGEVVVIHDSDLKKITGMNLKIWDATYDQLKSIDVGSWFAPDFKDQRIPTLKQVLRTCKGRARVNIELKYYGHDQRLEERVVEIVESTDMVQDVAFMSLNYTGILKIRTLRPNWKIGLLTSLMIGDVMRLDVDFLAVNAGFVTRSLVKHAHEHNKEVIVWTVNDPIGMSTMMSRGVDGIITDEPALAVSVIEQRAGLSSPERLILELAGLFGWAPEVLEQ